MRGSKVTNNMYDFITKKWKPLGGECEHDCIYCSTRYFKERYPQCKAKYSGEYYLDNSEMKKDWGCGHFVFVCSTMDLFAKRVPYEFIEKIISKCHGSPENRYLFQTKNPYRFWDFIGMMREENMVLGTTIETSRDTAEYGKAPMPKERYHEMKLLHERTDFKLMVTIEPIMDFDLDELVAWIRDISPLWVNIGADSKNHHLPEPPKEKISSLINELSKFTEVKTKDNLRRLMV